MAAPAKLTQRFGLIVGRRCGTRVHCGRFTVNYHGISGEHVPTSKSAAKRLRQNERRRVANKATRSRLRTAIKRVRLASRPEEASEAFREAVKLIDRAAGRGLVHRNRAARSKARLAAHVRKAGGTV